uniref:C1 protein n=1 Tax=Banana bunchy top virus TaxID=12585 RepID=Q83028_BBTV|nr:C1 [Banana bunchy top virus]prf//2122372C ORF C1 [Banana bunchy top virus]
MPLLHHNLNNPDYNEEYQILYACQILRPHRRIRYSPSSHPWCRTNPS